MLRPASTQARERPYLLLSVASRRSGRRSGRLVVTTSIVLLSVLVCILNAFKPFHATGDDYAYYLVAKQISEKPFEPYGFESTWGHARSPANLVLAPPVLMYWWALAMHIFGESPTAWRLSLLPIVLIGNFSLYSLFRRFAPVAALALTCTVAVSPAMLPSLNMMLDVPALALQCAALSLFGIALERRSSRSSVAWAIFAGVVAGLAMQTKYTAFTTPVAIVLWSICQGRVRVGLTAAIVSVSVFAGWEMFVAFQHGASHFLTGVDRQNAAPVKKAMSLALAAISLMGSLGFPCLLIALHALGARTAAWKASVALYSAGMLLLLISPADWQVILRRASTGEASFRWSQLFFTVFGVLFWACMAAVAVGTARTWRLLRRRTPEGVQEPIDGLSILLVAWFAVEWAAYLTLSPFPAARRVLMLLVVGMLMAARLGHRLRSDASQATVAGWAFGASLVLGLTYFAADFADARSDRQAVAEAENRRIGSGPPAHRTWFIQFNGSRQYAEKLGWRPLLFEESALEKGDWLIVFHTKGWDPKIQFPQGEATKVSEFTVEGVFPLRARGGFYAGRTPVERVDGPRVVVEIFQTTKGPLRVSAIPR